MIAQCCTAEDPKMDLELRNKRKQAIEIMQKAMNDVHSLGFFVHTCYSPYFFIEPIYMELERKT